MLLVRWDEARAVRAGLGGAGAAGARRRRATRAPRSGWCSPTRATSRRASASSSLRSRSSRSTATRRTAPAPTCTSPRSSGCAAATARRSSTRARASRRRRLGAHGRVRHLHVGQSRGGPVPARPLGRGGHPAPSCEARRLPATASCSATRSPASSPPPAATWAAPACSSAGRTAAGVPAELVPWLGAGLAELALWPRRAAAARVTSRGAGGDRRRRGPAVHADALRGRAARRRRRRRAPRAPGRARRRATMPVRSGTAARARRGNRTGARPPPPAHTRLGEAELSRALGAPDAEAWAAAARPGSGWSTLPRRLRPLPRSRGGRRGGPPRAGSPPGRAAGRRPGSAPIRCCADRRAGQARAARARARAAPGAGARGRARADAARARGAAARRRRPQQPSNRQRLYISDNTAGVHVSHILSKLNVPNRAAAAGVAHRAGLLDGAGP